MLSHITMTHNPDNCPMNLLPDDLKKFFIEAEKMFDSAKQRNLNIHFFVGGVGHIMYALVESDSFNALNNFFGSMQFKQDLHIEPVGNVKDIITEFKNGELTKH